jgi:hypothetical protein
VGLLRRHGINGSCWWVQETAAGKTIGIEAPPQAPQAPPKTAFGMMKDRATMARNTITPHMQQMKEKTSKRYVHNAVFTAKEPRRCL